MLISWTIRIPNFAWIRNGKSFFKTHFGLIVAGRSMWIIQPHIVCFVRHKLTKSFRPRPWNWIRVEIRFTNERQHNVNVSWRSFISQIRPSVFVWIIIFSNDQYFIVKRIWIVYFRNISFPTFKRSNQKQQSGDKYKWFHVEYYSNKRRRIDHFSFLYSSGCFDFSSEISQT